MGMQLIQQILFAILSAAAIFLFTKKARELRRNILLRSLFFVVFAAATLACLFWWFTI